MDFLLIALLTLLNGLFAMSEMALSTSRRARLAAMDESGDGGARVALKLMDDPTQFLSTVQVGITLVGVLTGAFGGATISGYLAVWLRQIPAVAGSADGLALGIVVVVITYVTLIAGELVPKRLALVLRPVPDSFLPSPIAPIALVATTTSARRTPSALSAPPTNSSDCPSV